jgi:cytochrome c biogenesis protein CcdA
VYKRWQPGSRRDRRRNRGSSRRSRTEGADKNVLIVAGLFALGLALVFALFLYLVYSNV